MPLLLTQLYSLLNICTLAKHKKIKDEQIKTCNSIGIVGFNA